MKQNATFMSANRKLFCSDGEKIKQHEGNLISLIVSSYECEM